MIDLSRYGKKRLAVFALAAVAAVGGWSLYNRQAADPNSGHDAPALAPKPVTMEEYRAAAAEAGKLFVAGDASAVSASLSALEKVRVPREGMGTHQEFVMALAAYRAALASGSQPASDAASSRLRSFASDNPWCGFNF